MKQFQVGDKVSFISNSGKELIGTVVKVNPKTYKIQISDTNGPDGKYRWVMRRKDRHQVNSVGA